MRPDLHLLRLVAFLPARRRETRAPPNSYPAAVLVSLLALETLLLVLGSSSFAGVYQVGGHHGSHLSRRFGNRVIPGDRRV